MNITQHVLDNYPTKTIDELIKECDRPRRRILHILREHNLTEFQICKSHKTQEHARKIQYVKEHYLEMSNKEMAKNLKCSNFTIREIKKELNIEPVLKSNETFYSLKDIGFSKYSISKNGTIVNNKSKIIIKHFINSGGYPFVNIVSDEGSYKNKSIHILLAKMFIINPDPSIKIEVNHKDCNKLNYSLDNLEWVTKSENALHAHKMGLSSSKKGEASSKAKYTEQDVRNVCKLLNQGYLISQIIKIYPQYSYYFIRCLKDKRTWRHITIEYF